MGPMKNVIQLAPAIKARNDDREALRAEMLAFSENPIFPGEQIIDQGTQLPTLDEEAERSLLRLFELFGITELNPLDPDFDLVSNTWYMLTKVASSLRSRQLFYDTLYVKQRTIWHPTYAAYVDALWDGNMPEIVRCAKAMSIHRGVPERASRLRDGPIQ